MIALLQVLMHCARVRIGQYLMQLSVIMTTKLIYTEAKRGFVKKFRTEMRMLRWAYGITVKDKKRNDDICHAIACITDKECDARLRWYGQVYRV